MMKAVALGSSQFGNHLGLLRAMYQLRGRVFQDRLNWNVVVSGGLELDVFDTLNPFYLLVLSDNDDVVGCVRLLPTTAPTMLGETFSALLDGHPVPRSETILESSRFCVDTRLAGELGAHGLNRATFMLFAAMIEGIRAVDAKSIVTVTDLRMERVLRRAGWPLERIASPRPIGATMALAGYLHDSDEVLATMYRQAGVVGPVLGTPSNVQA
ncbi:MULTISPECIES: acyl-homoserine-lactone synthase [Bradyrhizobium]|nr:MULTISPECIES: acyl-homoserine-lactone synthase [Bradyrhizobium]